jgi:hypothetical protein
MTNGSILLTENESPFSPISVLHYRHYRPGEAAALLKGEQPDIQCVVGQENSLVTRENSVVTRENSVVTRENSVVGLENSVVDPENSAPDTTRPIATPAGPVLRFGEAQQPGLEDYADGADTMAFLRGLQ